MSSLETLPRCSAMTYIDMVLRPCACLEMVLQATACLDMVHQPSAFLDMMPWPSAMPSHGASAECNNMHIQGAFAKYMPRRGDSD